MKDQIESKCVCTCNRKSPDDELHDIARYMDHIHKAIGGLKKRNQKLYQIVRDSGFSGNFWELQESMDEISSEVEDLAPSQLLTPLDAQDKGELDNPLLQYGDV